MRVLLLAGAVVTGAAAWVTVDQPAADGVTAWLHRRFTREPDAAWERLQAAAAANDHERTIASADEFFGLVTLPHPADAYGARYRDALRLQMRAAEARADFAARIRAGERAFAFDSRDSWLLFRFGVALRDAGQHARALEVLRAAHLIRPVASQIVQAIEDVPALDADVAAAVRRRHYEALALCMVLPTWMRGNLVAPGTPAVAVDIRLQANRATELRLDVTNQPTGFYLVLPRLAELEVKVESARFVAPDGSVFALEANPSGTFLAVEHGFARSVVPPTADFEAANVINLPPTEPLPAAGRVEVVIRTRPSATVAPYFQAFGSARHPGVKAIAGD